MKIRIGLKSIKTKMICYILSIVLLVCAGLALISYNIASSALTNAVNESLLKITQEGSLIVEERINGYYGQLNALASNNIFQDLNANRAQILPLLSKLTKEWGYLDIFMADMSGMTTSGTMSTSINISERDYFQKALSGSNAISDPVISKNDSTMQIFMAVPIKNGNGSVIGVLVGSRDGNGLSGLIADVTYAETGKAFMKNSKGITIAHSNKDNVINQENIFEQVKTDPSLAELAALEEKMCAGEEGVGKYTYQGQTKYMGYSPVGIEGWSIALAAPQEEVFSDVDMLARLTAAASVIFLILSIFLAVFIAGSITKPLKRAVARADSMAQGDLSRDMDGKFLKRGDEIGALAISFQKITDNMNEVLSSISSAAEQVSTGAKQVADSSMSLSQGAAEQASSVEELAATIEEISAQTSQNADHARDANKIAEDTRINAEKGGIHMKGMLGAMDDINTSSTNISKIIKVIDDIAFQTNILALNAAVEAARAGQYGKGFAVVAEEVRNLAARSANAAKETTDMIEGSVKSVENGARIAKETSEALISISEGTERVAALVKDIAAASNEQSLGISQVSQGITQVSSVVQSNSAVSEESAASSEEMSAQAKLLEEQVRRFKLRKDKTENTNSDARQNSRDSGSKISKILNTEDETKNRKYTEDPKKDFEEFSEEFTFGKY